MKSNDVFPSKYLKAEDFEGELTVVIKGVELEELKTKDNKSESKPVAYFRGTAKGLVLNKTNWALIAKQLGDESDDWVGRKITLFKMDVDSFGDIVEAIRVRPKVREGAEPLQAPVQGANGVKAAPGALDEAFEAPKPIANPARLMEYLKANGCALYATPADAFKMLRELNREFKGWPKPSEAAQWQALADLLLQASWESADAKAS